MKTFRFFLLLFFGLNATLLFSQKLIIPEKKMYVAPDSTVYIQKELPVYLLVSVSPNDKSKSVVLKSKETPQYANPLYLDAEGFNSFRTPYAVDKKTKQIKLPKQDILFEVYADSKPPVTSISYGETPFKKRGVLYITKDLSISFTAKDEQSGVDKILYSIDSADYKEYTAPFNLTPSKRHILKYYSYDHVGNVEKLKSQSFFVSDSKPKTTMNIVGDQYEQVLSGNTTISLKAEKDSTGIAHIIMKMDDHPEHNYISSISTTLLLQGEHILTYYAVNNVGLKEDPHTYAFYVDKTPPTIIQDIVGKTFMVNGQEYSSGRSMLKLTALDNKAGVKAIYYSINNGKYIQYDKPVVLNAMKGGISIRAYAIDNVNNKGLLADNSKALRTSYVDLTGPSLSYVMEGPVFITDTIYISSKTKIHLKGYDNESGLNNIQYRVDGKELSLYNEPFSIDGEGMHTIEYIGTDNVENTSNSSFKVYVDNTGPAIFTRFSTPQKGISKEDGKSMDIYPNQVVLFIAATDNSAGYDHMTYSLNDQPVRPFAGFITGFAPKNKVVINAYDKLGNVTTSTIEFEIQP